MRVTFPHMGNAYISVKVLLDEIGIDYVIPPLFDKKSFEEGIFNSPEFICLPFKKLLGDFLYGLKNGADTILFGGGCGQCRQGYYSDVYKEILDSLGYKYEFININVKKISVKDILSNIKPLVKGKSSAKIMRGVLYALRTCFAVDDLYSLANKIRCREINKGRCDRILKEFINNILKVKGYRAIFGAVKNAKAEMLKIETDDSLMPLKIAIVGEIFIACEPYTNLEIEKKLGSLGVMVRNRVSVSGWIKERFLLNLLPFKPKNRTKEAAFEFMKTDYIGGHGINTVGDSVLSSKEGYDGIIQLLPFTCMPEIIAQSTFNEIQKKYNTPIMTLILDEMTGEAGYMTRLEAFVDMIRMRKNTNFKENLEIEKKQTA